MIGSGAGDPPHRHIDVPTTAGAGEPVAELQHAVRRACADKLITRSLCDDAIALCDGVDREPEKFVEVAAEIRALLSGAALRSSRIGMPCCGIADALLREIVGEIHLTWGGMTVPGTEDRANARTGVVELRFPAADFWAIPAVAHELGHVLVRAKQVGAHLGAANPAPHVVNEGPGPPAQREELLCDFLGTYLLGPAYVAFMIHERLDPATAAPDLAFLDPKASGASHPTPDKRVWVMLRTLERLDDATGAFHRPHAHARSRLSQAWQERTGHVGGPGASTVQALDTVVTRLWSELNPVLDARFTVPMAASTLPDALRNGKAVDIESTVRVLDVVTAAWRARISASAPDDLSGLAIRARDLAVAVSERPGRGGERT